MARRRWDLCTCVLYEDYPRNVKELILIVKPLDENTRSQSKVEILHEFDDQSNLNISKFGVKRGTPSFFILS